MSLYQYLNHNGIHWRFLGGNGGGVGVFCLINNAMTRATLKNSSDVFNWKTLIFFDSAVSLEAQRPRNRIGCSVCHCKCDKFCKNHLPHACIWGPRTSADFSGANDWRHNEIYGFIYPGVYIKKKWFVYHKNYRCFQKLKLNLTSKWSLL